MKGSNSPQGLAGERLGAHHFAYLRALAEGLSRVDAAHRYLPIAHGAEIAALHRLTVERVRGVARRRGDPRWRLVSVEIQEVPPPLDVPSIDQWAEAEGLDDWSQVELAALYAERFGSADPPQRRRDARNARLRERRLALLRELEATAAEPARSSDLLEGWLAPDLVLALRNLGAVSLADLQARIRRGGRWWLGIAGYGPTKARRLVEYLELLLAPGAAHSRPGTQTDARFPVMGAGTRLATLSGAQGLNRAVAAFAGTEAKDDRAAVEAWIAARATSDFTKKQYAREADRFILWRVLERDKAMRECIRTMLGYGE